MNLWLATHYTVPVVSRATAVSWLVRTKEVLHSADLALSGPQRLVGQQISRRMQPVAFEETL